MPTPTVEKQVEQPAAASRESATRQQEAAPSAGAGLDLGVEGLLSLQATAGNAAVTALLGGGAPIETPPPASAPELANLSPPDALARASNLPPAQLLTSLGSVLAAIGRAAKSEHAALTAAAPRWHLGPDAPTVAGGERPAIDSHPIADHHAIPDVASHGTGAPEAAEVVHLHSNFQQSLQVEASAHARQAAEPMGEHAIVASASPEAVIAAVPAPPEVPVPPPVKADDDEGVSRVAAEERGPEIQAAIGSGTTAMAQLNAEHAAQQAALRAEAQRGAGALDAENRSQRDAERGAAIAEVAGIRKQWTAEQRAVLADAGATAQAASQTARSGIAENQAEAEHAAAVARAQGQHDAKKAQSQGPGGGILGAIGSVAQSVLDKVGQAVKGVLQAAEHLAAQALEKGRSLIRTAVATAARAFEAAAARGRSLLVAAGDRFRRAIAERVAQAKAAVTRLMTGLQQAAKRTLDASARALGATVQLLQTGWHAAVDGVRSAVQGALQFARSAIQALGAFGAIIRDVAANPVQWVAHLAASAQDGIRNHLWPDLQQAVREWFDGKVEALLGLGTLVWGVLQRGGITVAQIGHIVWEGIKAAIPPTLISILIEKIVSLLVPAAAAALLIVQAIQAAWGSLSRIVQAFDAFMHFLRSVRLGNAGPLFGKAIAAGAVAVIDFVSNFLLQRIGGPIKRVAGRLKALATRLGGGIKGGLGSAKRLLGEAGEDAAAFARRNANRFRQSRVGEIVLAPITKVKAAREATKLKARGGSAPIHLTPKEFAQSEDAQIALLSAARKVQAEQDAFGKGLLKDLGINGDAYSILKRDSPEDFTEGILNKCKRKGYTNIGQMDDIVRGRFDLESEAEVRRVVGAIKERSPYRRLTETAPRVQAGVEGGYPRFHVVLLDAKTGITHEWQVGTKAVSTLYETESRAKLPAGLLPLPGGMRASLHDIEYDIFASIDNYYPRLSRTVGIPSFRTRVANLAAQAGRGGHEVDAAALESSTAELHREAIAILNDIIARRGSDFVKRFFH